MTRILSIPRRRFAFATLACAVALVPVLASADATDAVRAWLAKNGIQESYDAEKARFVFVGDTARERRQLDGPDFVKVREQAALAALLSAKRELLAAIDMKVSGEDSVELAGDGAETVQTTKSVVDVFAKRVLHGCTVLDVEESFEGGVYQVAVAVAWSEKLEKAAVAALAGTGSATTPEQDEAEWAAWAARTDFARRVGPAQFTDSHGVYRYAGVGCADIEGKKGKALLDAKRAAEQMAKQALAHSLWADTVAHDQAVTILRERAAENGEETAEATEDFSSRVSQACKKNILARKVFAGKVVHPLTGRTIFVHVAGVDPATLAEQKILEEDNK